MIMTKSVVIIYLSKKVGKQESSMTNEFEGESAGNSGF